MSAIYRMAWCWAGYIIGYAAGTGYSVEYRHKFLIRPVSCRLVPDPVSDKYGSGTLARELIRSMCVYLIHTVLIKRCLLPKVVGLMKKIWLLFSFRLFLLGGCKQSGKAKYISININIFAIEKGTSNQNSRIRTIKYPDRRVKNCVF